ncbi:MAG TPA: hypothetical protein VFW31_01265 [Candidatus Angelobacter sp.]|nr:hypothetical protein [Candidatus Angelobacter sp.]
MKKYSAQIRIMLALAALLFATPAFAQNPTATGVINATLINKNGIALVFDSDPGGVTLGAAGTSAATLNFGTISAFGPLAPGVTRTSVTAANYTVRTVFDVQVIQGGLNSTTYTLSAQLASALPAGFSFKVDGVTLVNGPSNIQTNAVYNVDVPHNLDLTVSTAAPGAGGPALGTPQSTVINFQASAN